MPKYKCGFRDSFLEFSDSENASRSKIATPDVLPQDHPRPLHELAAEDDAEPDDAKLGHAAARERGPARHHHDAAQLRGGDDIHPERDEHAAGHDRGERFQELHRRDFEVQVEGVPDREAERGAHADGEHRPRVLPRGHPPRQLGVPAQDRDEGDEEREKRPTHGYRHRELELVDADRVAVRHDERHGRGRPQGDVRDRSDVVRERALHHRRHRARG
eukprot:31003-Pelagococcus_subviridis.AAC.4